MATDLAITASDDGKALLAHTIDCPMVIRHRAGKRPILTLFDCQETTLPVAGVEDHECRVRQKAKSAHGG